MPATATAPTREQPAIGRPSSWTEERLKIVYDRYVVGGETAAAVASDIGVSPSAIRAKVNTRPDWKRDPALGKANHARAAAANIAVGRAAMLAKPKPVAPPPPAPAPVAATTRQPFTLNKTPVSVAQPLKDPRSLGDRILSALRSRPLPAPTLAILIDAKEHYVAVQLAALAAAGKVEAGPAICSGQRHRLWSAAA